MKMNTSAAFICCLCIVAVYSSGEKANKIKRDVSGLFPFPRVGRIDPSWYPKYMATGPREMKRQGLIPFPRVGRSGDGNFEKKRDLLENGGAMWFGPRLGRVQKRNYPSDWALIQIRDLPFPSNKKDFTSSLLKESSEEIDQTKDYHT